MSTYYRDERTFFIGWYWIHNEIELTNKNESEHNCCYHLGRMDNDRPTSGSGPLRLLFDTMRVVKELSNEGNGPLNWLFPTSNTCWSSSRRAYDVHVDHHHLWNSQSENWNWWAIEEWIHWIHSDFLWMSWEMSFRWGNRVFLPDLDSNWCRGIPLWLNWVEHLQREHYLIDRYLWTYHEMVRYHDVVRTCEIL